MATAEEYAAWIVKNADKKGTPEFNTVAAAYQDAKSKINPEPAVEEPKAKPYEFRNPYIAATVPSLMNIAQGLSFGFGDELAGLAGADKERYRATLDKFSEDYPASATIGKISGGMLVPFGGAKTAKMLYGMNPYGVAATTGAIGGALSGAGESRSVEESPFDAGKGALAGAVAAPILGLGMTTGGSVLGAFGAQLGSRTPGLKTPLSEILARNRVATALERDKVDAGSLHNTLADLGQEGRIVDAAGENTRNLMDVNASLPGQTKNDLEAAIRARQAGRADRLNPVVDLVGNNQGRAGVVNSAWEAQKLQNSAPLYAKFESKPVGWDKDLGNMLQVVEQNGLHKRAAEIASFDAPGTKFNFDPASLSQDPKALNYIKQALDDKIAAEIAKGDKKDGNLIRVMVGFKNRFVQKVDDLSGGTFKPALDAYAGPASMQAALNNGRRFLNGDAESLGVTMAGLSSAEQDAFRIGAAEALRQKLGSPSGQTEYMNIWKNRNIRERLETLFGDPSKMEEALRVLKNESTMQRMERIGRGSQTASRLQGAEDQTMGVAEDMLGLVGKAKMGMWPSLLGGLNKYSTQLGTPEPVRDTIGRILLSNDAGEIGKLVASQNALKARRLANALTASTATNQVASALTGK